MFQVRAIWECLEVKNIRFVGGNEPKLGFILFEIRHFCARSTTTAALYQQHQKPDPSVCASIVNYFM